ncbi:MAG TPA: hypothetical protein ENJ19_10935 [Gammaproteobacteria bacterium]|nr:hypothetical protein [Gammaproteobacteria bacterium]
MTEGGYDILAIGAAVVTFILMVVAFYLPRRRWFHMPVMIGVILFDVLMPVYLYLTRDWYQRLIEQEEIFMFSIWMHFGLVLTLYALYVLQIMTARKILAGDAAARTDHHWQGKAILLVRALVILTAATLLEPTVVQEGAV